MSAARTGRDEPNLPRAFDAQARYYDKLVSANPGYHEHLRMTARRMGLPNHGAGLRLLDLGCGTGASTAALLDVAPEADITGVDASAEMLAMARRKPWPPRVRFLHGDVDELDRLNLTGQYDGILAAYLLRNVPDRNASLRAFHALLRPRAPLAVHEYSVKDSLRGRMVWNAVSWGVIIPMARVRTGSADLHRYLWRSVLGFDGVESFCTRMEATGYTDVIVSTMPGWQQHIVHTFLGRKPGTPSGLAAEGDPTEADTPPVGLDMTKPDGVDGA